MLYLDFILEILLEKRQKKVYYKYLEISKNITLKKTDSVLQNWTILRE